MPNDCSSHHHCHYFYQASAYGLAGEFQRPVQQSIPALAACSLSSSGGHAAQRHEKYSLSPFIRFDNAYTEAGGSYDDCHKNHTTYVCSVVEGLNIADVVTADRVVSRMVIYSPKCGEEGEHSFDITGSYFDNLKVAGHALDVKLSTQKFHANDTYSKFETAFHSQDGADLLPWGRQTPEQLDELEKREQQYHALSGIGGRAKQWHGKADRPKGGTYWSSAAGHLNLNEQLKDTELESFGGIILIPKFGVVRLAQVLVRKDYRRLVMFQVQMCSGAGGTTDGPTSGAGGGTHYP